MPLLLDIWDKFFAFMEQGGEILTLIFVSTALMWTLILERTWYFRKIHPPFIEGMEAAWKQRTDHKSWQAHQIRNKEISRARQQGRQSLGMIKTLVALCPMLGLFGTVSGMIEVFDVMAVAGNGNPRAMAEGITYATITTMAGMVAALSGLYFSVQLEQRNEQSVQRLADHLEVKSK